MARAKTFNLRLDDQERQRLEVLAWHHAAPLATAVRMIVKQAYDELSAEEIEEALGQISLRQR